MTSPTPPTPSPSRSVEPVAPRGWWSISANDAEKIRPEARDAMRAALDRAVAKGEHIVTVEGITLTFHEAATNSPEPPVSAGLRDALLPVVEDWFDTGYEAGRLDTVVLTDRILAALSLVERAKLDRLRAVEAAARATGWNELDGRCWCVQSRELTGSPEHEPRCAALRAALTQP